MQTRISQITAAIAVIGILAYDVSIPTQAEPVAALIPTDVPEISSVFRSLPLEARAALVYDLSRDTEMFSRNPDEVLALASLTKLMMAYVAAQSLDKDAVVEISQDDVDAEGDNGLYIKERWRFEDLLDLTLMVSSNDGAHAIASAVEAVSGHNTTDQGIPFVAMMNVNAHAHGLSSMKFFNSTGLDLGGSAGGYGSARDVVRLLSLILHEEPDVLGATSHPQARLISLSGKEHAVESTNTLVSSIPRLIASKTGYTDIAGGNLVVAYDAELLRPIIIVVLGSSYDGRFHDTELLMEAVRQYVKL